MRLHGLRRFLVALAIVPILAGSALASASAMFVCRGDSVARTECCCPGGHSDVLSAPTGPGARLTAACCCDVAQAKASVTAAVTSPRGTQTSARAFVAIIYPSTCGALSADIAHWPAFRLAHPPPLAVPILLGKQSFLI